MIKEALASKKYWKGVLWSGLLFILIISVFELAIPLYRLGLQKFLATYFSTERWPRFLVSRFVGGLLYGMIITFASFRRMKKEQRTDSIH